MRITTEKTDLQDVIIVHPEIFRDERGFFSEIYRADQFKELGLPETFVQFNHSGSVRGVLRGLHFQWEPPMGKLMRVTRGEAWLVAVDIRKNSPNLGRYFGKKLTAEVPELIWAPAGFARGFCVLSDYAEIQYLTTGVYNHAAESGIRWNDPALGIDWPIKDPQVSKKDETAQTLEEWLAKPESNHFMLER